MKKKKIATVVGLGVSGYGAALLLSRKGWHVRITEEKDTPDIRESAARLKKSGAVIEFEAGAHTKAFIKGADLVITSPGARDDSDPITWARQLNIPVIDEIELGYRYCPAKIVAVTGTNGKSTTVTLIGEILRAGGYHVSVCGNIGKSFCEEVLKIKKDWVVVLEASSFQLQRIDGFRPYVAVFLNITQNHFDRHEDFSEYLNAKLNMFKNQKNSDWAVLNCENKNLARHIKSCVLYFDNNLPKDIVSADELLIKGAHNLKNVAAAILAGRIFKVDPKDMRRSLMNFRGLKHRCEYVEEIGGVTFINDSKATTVDAAICAIRSVGHPVILIAGGRDKGSDFTVLRNVAEESVKEIILIGEAREKIKTQLLGTAPIYEAKDIQEAVNLGFKLAKARGDTVLLSPMCASFDMFKNFQERGDAFKKAVGSLKEKVYVET